MNDERRTSALGIAEECGAASRDYQVVAIYALFTFSTQQCLQNNGTDYLSSYYSKLESWIAHVNMGKVCFVTTGATAPFTLLIESVLNPSSVDALVEAGFTDLLIQYGTAQKAFENRAGVARARLVLKSPNATLNIEGMAFNARGLHEQFVRVQESKGLVISHAGKKPQS